MRLVSTIAARGFRLERRPDGLIDTLALDLGGGAVHRIRLDPREGGELAEALTSSLWTFEDDGDDPETACEATGRP